MTGEDILTGIYDAYYGGKGDEGKPVMNRKITVDEEIHYIIPYRLVAIFFGIRHNSHLSLLEKAGIVCGVYKNPMNRPVSNKPSDSYYY